MAPQNLERQAGFRGSRVRFDWDVCAVFASS